MEQHNKLIRNKLSNYLKGKRVAIVGPASSIIGSKQAALIDSYDVVVRLNKALPIPPDLSPDVGSRTDILYNCMNPTDECGGTISINVLNKAGIKFLVGAYPPVDSVGTTKLRIKTDTLMFYHKNRNYWNNFCYTDKTHFLTLWKSMRLPNTGTMAILDLLRFDIKELYITGITFFKGGYIRTYRDYDEKGIIKHLQRFNLHLPEKQLQYASTQLLKDKRVILDNTLSDILNGKNNHIDNNNPTSRKQDSHKNDKTNESDETDGDNMIEECNRSNEINESEDQLNEGEILELNMTDYEDDEGDQAKGEGDEVEDDEGEAKGDDDEDEVGINKEDMNQDDPLYDSSVVANSVKSIINKDTVSDLIVEADSSGHDQLDKNKLKD
ncbi:MAG: glycosyltransferase family 29 protein, partial [Candidatus Paceibacterota bacterium]